MILTESDQMFTMTADRPGVWEKDSDSSSSGIGTAEVTETVSNSSELDDDQTFLPTPNSTPNKESSVNGYHKQTRSYSTGSEQSWDGTGSTSSGNDHLSVSSSPNLTPVKHDKLHLSNSYDSSVSKILNFHRNLAAYYNHGPKNIANRERNSYYGSCESLGPNRTPDKLNRAQDLNSGIPTSQLKSILRQNGRNHGTGSPDFTKISSPTYENFPILPSKMKCIKFNLSTINENRDRTGPVKREVFSTSDLKRGLNGTVNGDLSAAQRRRSSSLDFIAVDDNNSDGDNDDYGFLTYYGSSQIAYFSTAMQKAKSPSPAHRIFPKRWRRSKLGGSSSSNSSSLGGKSLSSQWKPEGGCIWSNQSGRRAVVPGTSLLQLSHIERILLQKIALAKLQAMQLGCSISVPKDGATKRSKKPFSLKRKTNSEPSGSGWVFGIPLSKSVANDVELRRRRPSQLKERRDSLDIPHAIVRKSSSSSVSYGRSHSEECGYRDRTNLDVERSVSYNAGAVSSDSLSETDTRSAASNLLDALSLSSSSKLESSWREQKGSLCTQPPQVPYIVKSCCKHLETYGLQVLGIFRIGCSKKRIRQLRDEFDSGKDVKLNEEYNPHDVGGLLKEFFRDLPDPLLCRDLYSAFVATRKIEDLDKRLNALRCLVALLPAANQDTLWTLVKFLALVAKHSTDTVDAEGNTIAGNKMDSHNLATLFAPSILHKAKGNQFEVESMERAGERREVIAVVKEIIDQHLTIFMLQAEMHDEILRVLHETNFEAADYILKRMPSSLGIDVDPETSSSFYEESDSSSIPRSPSYSSETDCPRNFNEALAMKEQLALRTAEPPFETLQVPQFRIISPDQAWYQPDRSPSPVSPRISPSPKAMKQLSQLNMTQAMSPSSGHSPAPAVLITPRPVRFRRTPMPSAAKTPSARSSSIPIRDSRTLTVPVSIAERRGSDSSSSSYYPYSSRSPSHSPLSHDPPSSPNPSSPRWYPETPPTTPSSKDKNFKQLTSSTHRPLGYSSSSHASEDGNSASRPLQEWQKERWKHWENIAKERSGEFLEQETLV